MSTLDGSIAVALTTAAPLAIAEPSMFAPDFSVSMPPAVMLRPSAIYACEDPNSRLTAIAPATLIEPSEVLSDGALAPSEPLALDGLPVAFESCAADWLSP